MGVEPLTVQNDLSLLWMLLGGNPELPLYREGPDIKADGELTEEQRFALLFLQPMLRAAWSGAVVDTRHPAKVPPAWLWTCADGHWVVRGGKPTRGRACGSRELAKIPLTWRGAKRGRPQWGEGPGAGA